MILIPRYRRRQRGWIMTPYRFSAGVSAQPGAGVLALTGQAPGIVLGPGATVTPGAASLLLAGQIPVLVQGTSATMSPAAIAAALVGQAPQVVASANATLAPGAGALHLAGQPPVVAAGTSTTVAPGAGLLALVGQAPLAVQGDPFYSSRVAGLHFEGSSGSTTFVDNCPSPQTYTAHPTADISTTQFKFGASALRLAGGYIDAPSASVFAPGTGDFGIGGWFRRDTAGSGNLFTFANQNWNVYYDNSLSKLKFWDGTADRIDGGAALAAATWVHIWLERTGTAVKLFSNGTQVGSTYTDSGPTNLTAAALMIGAYRSPSTAFFSGYVDDFLFYKGVSVYSSNFTPPTVTFPDA